MNYIYIGNNFKRNESFGVILGLHLEVLVCLAFGLTVDTLRLITDTWILQECVLAEFSGTQGRGNLF